MIIPVLILDSREKWRAVDVDESLAIVGYTWVDGWYRNGREAQRLDLPAMEPDEFKGLDSVVYHRVVKGGRLFWHQYWFWWPYNPKNYPRGSGVGEHEGDWELVQIGCRDEAGDEPILMTCSQHGGGERKHYWDVTLTDGKEGAPIVYVARDSHANYFAPARTATDQIDGKGEHITPTVREFGSWARYEGRWGNSANSPGPLTSRRAWLAPHAYHSQARG